MRRGGVALLWAAWLSLACAAPQPAPSCVNTRIQDLHAKATLTEAHLPALRQIGKDYANAYRFREMDVYFKEPDRIRFEMRAYGLAFTYVINGNTKHTLVPQLGIRQTSDIRTRPQTCQNSMELGFVTPSALRDYTTQFLRRDGKQLLFELRFRQADLRRKKTLLWVDPVRQILTRRELYHDDGTLKARFTYADPVEAKPGIWIPRRIAVYNAAGERGGVTLYTEIEVNTGLADALFEGV
ncbi:MAG: hypothetical protein QHJ73_00450 [Armatimonadota bacterium]|nr:hypothetical protein [Armatimonadota bacterium]